MRALGQVFALNGRIGRQAYWLRCGAVLAVFAVLLVFFDETLGRRSTLVLYPPLYLALVGLSARRLHDGARSALWLLLALVPILGALWLFFELGFRKGTPGDNPYGPDPLDDGRDYLTVK